MQVLTVALAETLYWSLRKLLEEVYTVLCTGSLVEVANVGAGASSICDDDADREEFEREADPEPSAVDTVARGELSALRAETTATRAECRQMFSKIMDELKHALKMPTAMTTGALQGLTGDSLMVTRPVYCSH